MLAIDLAPNCQFDSAFIVTTVRPDNVGYLATGAGYLGLLQLYLRIRATREVSTVEAAMVVAGLDELAAWLYVDCLPDGQRQKILRNLQLVDMLVAMLQVCS